MTAAFDIFGKDAFRKRYTFDGSRYPINKALFESWSVNLGRLNDEKLRILKERRDELQKKFVVTMVKDHAFETAISQGTGDISKVKRRFSTIERLIQEVLS